MLESVAIGHDEAMRSVPEVRGLVRPEESCAHARPNPVGADQDVAREDLATVGLDAHAVRRGFERGDAHVETDRAGREAVVEALVQVGPVAERPDREPPFRVERAIVSGRQPPSTVIEGLPRQVLGASRADTRRQPVGLEHGHGVRIHDDSGADRREPGRPLEHDDRQPDASELPREREPADPAAHDDRGEGHRRADRQVGRPNSDVTRAAPTISAISSSDGRRSKRLAASRILGQESQVSRRVDEHVRKQSHRPVDRPVDVRLGLERLIPGRVGAVGRRPWTARDRLDDLDGHLPLPADREHLLEVLLVALVLRHEEVVRQEHGVEVEARKTPSGAWRRWSSRDRSRR